MKKAILHVRLQSNGLIIKTQSKLIKKMKKLSLIVVILFFIYSCKKEENPPTPEATTPAPIPKDYKKEFIGNWSCWNWVYNNSNGATLRKRILFHQDINHADILRIAMHSYGVSDTTQHYTMFNGVAFNDTSYFNIEKAFNVYNFEGYLITDTTMMVYQYGYISGVKDTVQNRIFYKEK